MPEAYLEALEIKEVVRRLRSKWMFEVPDLREVTRQRTDWELVDGGFWSRARNDITPPATDESLRREIEHVFARQESQSIRSNVLDEKQALPKRFNLRNSYTIPPETLAGWRGAPIEYWRVPSLHHLLSELCVYTSPYREWLDSEIDVAALLSSPKSLTELWFYEISATDAPRQWLRGSFEFLQAFYKVTSGSPIDAQMSSHLVDVDAVVSADRNFCRFTEMCRTDAPFSVARGHLVSGGQNAVGELLALMENS